MSRRTYVCRVLCSLYPFSRWSPFRSNASGVHR